LAFVPVLKKGRNVPVGTVPTLKSVDGGTAPGPDSQTPGAESDIDFETAFPLIHPQGAILFQTDDNVYENNYTFTGFFNTFLDAIDGSYCTFSAFGETGDSSIDPVYPDPQTGGFKGALECGIYEPTNVISISYVGTETEMSTSYMERQCLEFMKLGLQGVSVVLASGDAGVANNGGQCIAETPTPIFAPAWPANCPYVTVLGSTFLKTGVEVAAAATTNTAPTYASGGGFSNVYPIPDYQASAVANYFSTSPPPYASYQTTNNSGIPTGGTYNSAGRG
jgi:tripeptidyl-peptidase-1